jgi:hypothetical protein
LADLYEVVDENIRVPDGALEGMVGRWSSVFGLRREDDYPRDSCEGGVSGAIVRFEWCRGPGADLVVHGFREGRESVARGCEGSRGEAGVRDVADGFGHGGERSGRLNPTHGASQRDAYEAGFSLVFREQEGQPRAVLSGEREFVETVFQIVLASGGRAVARVGMPHEAQDAMEGTSELHRLGGRMVDGGLVDALPGPGP